MLAFASNNLSYAARSFNPDDVIALNYLYGSGALYPNPFYRFRNSTNHHLLTTDYVEGYQNNLTEDGTQCKVYAKQYPGTVPLYRYKDNNPTGDYIYMTSLTTIPGFTLEGTAAYVWTSQVTGTVPLYRFYKASSGHFFTTNYAEGANNGYTYENLTCYVLPN